MRSTKSDLNEFKKHLTVSLSIDASCEPISASDSGQGDALGHAVTERVTPVVPQGRAVIEISSAWMASSFKNALKTVRDSSIIVPGFRPGKVPPEILRKRKTPIATDTMQNWILQDLGEVLGSYDSFQIVAPGTFSFEPSWREGEPFTVEATFACWSLPELSIDELCATIAREASSQGQVLDGEEGASEWLRGMLGQLIAPYISSDVLEVATQSYLDQRGGEGSQEEREAARVAVCRNLGAAFVIKRLGIEVSEEELKKNIGVIAAAEGMSFYDLYDGLIEEGGVETYRQHLQIMGALSAMSRRVIALQEGEITASGDNSQEVGAP
jgi:hypothetical protein